MKRLLNQCYDFEITKYEINDIIFADKRPKGFEIDNDLSKFIIRSKFVCLIVFSPLLIKIFSIIS
tara:strand:+ start:399 stop:593 length:195 start_codon:yes stop_codon:yes gene_type:complete